MLNTQSLMTANQAKAPSAPGQWAKNATLPEIRTSSRFPKIGATFGGCEAKISALSAVPRGLPDRRRQQRSGIDRLLTRRRRLRQRASEMGMQRGTKRRHDHYSADKQRLTGRVRRMYPPLYCLLRDGWRQP